MSGVIKFTDVIFFILTPVVFVPFPQIMQKQTSGELGILMAICVRNVLINNY